jgi:hypothetical protein
VTARFDQGVPDDDDRGAERGEMVGDRNALTSPARRALAELGQLRERRRSSRAEAPRQKELRDAHTDLIHRAADQVAAARVEERNDSRTAVGFAGRRRPIDVHSPHWRGRRTARRRRRQRFDRVIRCARWVSGGLTGRRAAAPDHLGGVCWRRMSCTGFDPGDYLKPIVFDPTDRSGK